MFTSRAQNPKKNKCKQTKERVIEIELPDSKVNKIIIKNIKSEEHNNYKKILLKI